MCVVNEWSEVSITEGLKGFENFQPQFVLQASACDPRRCTLK